MDFQVVKAVPADIGAHRQLFLAETKFQFIYNKCHGAGWTDDYLFKCNNIAIGYGSVWGKDKRDDRDTICEFYLESAYRKYARQLFAELIKISNARFVQFQTNDALLAGMAFELTVNLNAEAILFDVAFATEHAIAGAQFVQTLEPREWDAYCIQVDGDVVATGGFVWNYNFPYIDMYYEVKEPFRKQGYGALITQELKREAYRLGRVPSARCNVDNEASKATLLKAGMKVCGYKLVAETVI